jgi:hypothetical protein
MIQLILESVGSDVTPREILSQYVQIRITLFHSYLILLQIYLVRLDYSLQYSNCRTGR